MELTFVTSNKHKVEEVEAALGIKVDHVALDLPEVQALEVKDVVKEKARAAYDAIRRPLVVEDTGFYLKALNGFPGAFAKWFRGTIGADGICRLLNNFDTREAYAEACACYYDGKEFALFVGRADGTIAKKPKGTSGFGWDPIFIPNGYKTTFAEMSPSERYKISHRPLAFMKMKKWLDGFR